MSEIHKKVIFKFILGVKTAIKKASGGGAGVLICCLGHHSRTFSTLKLLPAHFYNFDVKRLKNQNIGSQVRKLEVTKNATEVNVARWDGWGRGGTVHRVRETGVGAFFTQKYFLKLHEILPKF